MAGVLAGMPPGKDVAELNANLRALGYGSALSGDAFTAATASAIDAFQAAHGLSQTGELLLGSVVFEPGPVRVTAVTPTLGATVQAGPVLDVTSLARQVTIELDAAEQSDVKVGDPVTITLPDNSTTPGRISYVGTVATVPSNSDQGGGGSSTPTIEVDVTPTDPAATGRLDQAPVNVSITTASVNNALVVPVNALLALASGGYAVEVIGAGGVRHLVAVNLGLFDDADGLVQVTGTSLTAGHARGGSERMSPVSETDSTLILPAPAGDGSADTVLELDDVSKIYGSEPPVIALDGRQLQRPPRRAARDRRALRLGQVDAAAPDGHARPAQLRNGSDHRPRRRRPVRPRAGRVAGDPDRLRLPAVLPRRARNGPRERRRRAPLRRRPGRRAARAGSRQCSRRSASATG